MNARRDRTLPARAPHAAAARALQRLTAYETVLAALPTWLLQERHARGLGRGQVARELGVRVEQVQAWERETGLPSPSSARAALAWLSQSSDRTANQPAASQAAAPKQAAPKPAAPVPVPVAPVVPAPVTPAVPDVAPGPEPEQARDPKPGTPSTPAPVRQEEPAMPTPITTAPPTTSSPAPTRRTPLRDPDLPVTWQQRAACNGIRPSIADALFFPASGKAERRAAKVADQTLCTPCPVRLDCLRHALRTPEREGNWAGTTPDERKLIIRRLRVSGYSPENAPDENLCDLIDVVRRRRGLPNTTRRIAP